MVANVRVTACPELTKGFAMTISKAVDGPTVRPDATTRPVESSISAPTICVLKRVKGAASGSPENVRTPLDTVALGFNNLITPTVWVLTLSNLIWPKLGPASMLEMTTFRRPLIVVVLYEIDTLFPQGSWVTRPMWHRREIEACPVATGDDSR